MINTERTTCFPLSFVLLTAYLKNDGSLEEILKTKKTPYDIPSDIGTDLKKHILPKLIFEKTENQYITIWLIKDSNLNTIVGSFSFKGKPNAKGAVEIGYGIEPQFRRQGYMREVLNGLINHYRTNMAIKYILAEIEKTNEGSLALVKSVKFEQIKRKSSNIWWAYQL
jgi:[ribosomal protein S5]-alanine N-acetyltransferase